MRHQLPFVIVLASLSFATSALAAPEGSTCTATTDCDSGLLCEVVGASGCAAPACPPGEPCEVPVCEPSVLMACVKPPCTVDADCGAGMACVKLDAGCACSPGTDCACPDETFTMCQPKECTADADCGGAGLECITQEWQDCPVSMGMPCEEGKPCPAPDPAECKTQSQSFCAPPYMGACSVDADCGENFTCVEDQLCACSGSASRDPSTPPVEECSCEASGTKYCQPKEIPCGPEGTCPGDWTCVGGATPDIACAPGAECPLPEPSPSLCMPPVWGGVMYRGQDESGPAYALSDGSAPVPAKASGAGVESSSESSDEGGCQVALGANPGSAGLFGLLALAGLTLARRRR